MTSVSPDSPHCPQLCGDNAEGEYCWAFQARSELDDSGEGRVEWGGGRMGVFWDGVGEKSGTRNVGGGLGPAVMLDLSLCLRTTQSSPDLL